MLRHALAALISLVVPVTAALLSLPGEEGPAVPAYRVAADWPRLPADLRLGPVTAVATDATDRVYLFHRGKRPILLLDADGKYVRSWGDDLVRTAHGLRLDPEGNVWTTDLGSHQVLKFAPSGKLLLALGTKGEPGQDREHFNKPADVAFGPEGEVLVADGYGNSRVVVFSKEGRYLREWGRKGKGDGELNLPHAIVVDRRGRVYVGDRENDRVQVFDLQGKLLAQWRQTGAPFGLFLTPEGHMLLADGRAHVTRTLDLEGKVLASRGEKGKGAGQHLLPHGICMDSKGAVYVTEVTGQRVQKLVPR